MQVKYKLRCRKNGILVTSNTDKYDVIWKREFNPKVYTIDLPKFNQKHD